MTSVNERGRFTPEPTLAAHTDRTGGGRERLGNLRPDIPQQIGDHFTAIKTGYRFDQSAVDRVYAGQDLFSLFEIADRAEAVVVEAVNRNNSMADIVNSHAFKETQERQIQQRGRAVVGKIVCIDGRMATAHTSGLTEGVHESLGGCVDTATSKLTGREELKSQTLDRAIADRPFQDVSQLLEIDKAHGRITYQSGEIDVASNCAAIVKAREEAARRGEPFESDDLVAENFRLMLPAARAITTRYNSAAIRAGQPELEKVVIRAFYDTDTQGTLLGFGENQPPLFTSALLEQLVPEIYQDLANDPRLREPGYYRSSFTRIDRFLDKEERTTDLIDYLLDNTTFRRAIADAANRLEELQGLTDEQKQALAFSLAKTMAFQWLTGLFKRGLAPDHPFAKHNEKFQALTKGDGYGATVGRNDPEVQVFAANTETFPEAIDHILTKSNLMGQNGAHLPYVLFICSGIAEQHMFDPEVRKGAVANVGTAFKGIMNNDEIARLVLSGKVIPVPVILSSRSNRVVEIPLL